MYLSRLAVNLFPKCCVKLNFSAPVRFFTLAVNSRENVIVNRSIHGCYSCASKSKQSHKHPRYAAHQLTPVRPASNVPKTKPQEQCRQISSEDLEEIFPLRYIFVRTSLDLWIDFPNGVKFDCGYVDSSVGSDGDNVLGRARAPVILGLPSSVGTHKELTGALMTLARMGCRVVIPNLPDSSLCRGEDKMASLVFNQSTLERAGFIRDFLKELKITKVDMVVSNSCSVYSAIHLASTSPDLVQSMMLINPTGLHYTKAMLPVRFHKVLAYIWEDRMILHPILKPFLAIGKQFTQKRSWPTSNIVTHSRIVNSLMLTDKTSTADTSYVMNAKQVGKQGIPVFTIYGESNRDFDQTSSEEYLEMIGLPQSSISVYNQEQKKMVSKGSPVGTGMNSGVFLQGQTADISQWHQPFIRQTLLNYFKKVKPDL